MADAFETYITQEGDTLDLIVYDRFGSSIGATEAMLAANPGLALNAPKLAAGLTLRIPIAAKQDRAAAPRLWS